MQTLAKRHVGILRWTSFGHVHTIPYLGFDHFSLLVTGMPNADSPRRVKLVSFSRKFHEESKEHVTFGTTVNRSR